MRIDLDHGIKKLLKTFIFVGIVAFVFCIYHGWAGCSKRGDCSALIGDVIPGFLVLLTAFFLSLIFPEKTIDEHGVAEYGFFGRIKLIDLPWNEMGFVGSAMIMTGRTNDIPVRMIVCGMSPPRKLYQNSLHYREPRGKHINLPDRPDIRAVIQQYVGDRFEELE